MSKFKSGDRIVWLFTKQRGVVLGEEPFHMEMYEVGFDVDNAEDSVRGRIVSSSLEFEYIYDTPLYQSLR